jgi:hypothetical protein
MLSLALALATAGAVDARDSHYGVIAASAGTYRAPNAEQEMVSSFDAFGLEAEGAGWRLDLALEAWGRAGALVALEPVVPVACGQRLEYRRGALTEWYVNEARGLEQGFTIDTAPAGHGPLQLELTVGGGLALEVLAGGRDALLRNEAGESVLSYSGLTAFDASGRELFARLAADSNGLVIRVDDAGATYPVTVDPWIAVEVAKLVSSNTAENDRFGRSVAMDGDTAVAGAYNADTAAGNDAGAAYVFERVPAGSGPWTEVRMLTASDGQAFDEFGHSVGISADTVVVGAHLDDLPGLSTAGAVYVFERDAGGPDAWGEVSRIVASDPVAGNHFGREVAISGDTIAVGVQAHAHYVSGSLASSGVVYVYERDAGGPGAWGEVAHLTSSRLPELQAGFGTSVAVGGELLVVGAPYEYLVPSVFAAGGAYVFELSPGGAPVELAALVPAAQEATDLFGSAVAVEGNTILVGAQSDRHVNGTPISGEGSVYVFERTGAGSNPVQQVAWLTAPVPQTGDLFGAAVALSGGRAVVGMPQDNAGGPNAGAAVLFERDAAGAWSTLTELLASDAKSKDLFGFSVAMAGATAVVGARDDNHNGKANAGAAYVYELGFVAENYCVAGHSAGGCQASISAVGTASATASSGFDLIITGIEGARDGFFLYATNGRQANPWGNGTSSVCVVPPRRRGGLLAAVGTAGQCDGAFSQDLNARWCPSCPKPLHNPGAGALLQAQMWYRDPQSTSNQTSSLSDALEVWVAP